VHILLRSSPRISRTHFWRTLSLLHAPPITQTLGTSAPASRQPTTTTLARAGRRTHPGRLSVERASDPEAAADQGTGTAHPVTAWPRPADADTNAPEHDERPPSLTSARGRPDISRAPPPMRRGRAELPPGSGRRAPHRGRRASPAVDEPPIPRAWPLQGPGQGEPIDQGSAADPGRRARQLREHPAPDQRQSGAGQAPGVRRDHAGHWPGTGREHPGGSPGPPRQTWGTGKDATRVAAPSGTVIANAPPPAYAGNCPPLRWTGKKALEPQLDSWI